MIAHAESHVATDEAGAAGFFSGGATLLTADTPLGQADARGGRGPGQPAAGAVHSVKPRALSLTQATELGTVYTLDEVRGLTEVARRHGLKVHMDGARFANAVAALGCSPADLSWRAGVDVLCFGGVKNGLAAGEAVLFFDRALAHEFEWRVKQAGQLNSKMRLVTAPWLGLLEGDVWLANARHANAMARRLAERIAEVAGRAADGAGGDQRRVRGARRRRCRSGCARRAGASTPGGDRLPPDVRLGHGAGDGRPLRGRPGGAAAGRSGTGALTPRSASRRSAQAAGRR